MSKAQLYFLLGGISLIAGGATIAIGMLDKSRPLVITGLVLVGIVGPLMRKAKNLS